MNNNNNCYISKIKKNNEYNAVGTTFYICSARKYLIDKFNGSKNNKSILIEDNKHKLLLNKIIENENADIKFCHSKYNPNKYIFYIQEPLYNVKHVKKINNQLPICVNEDFLDLADTMVDDIFNIIFNDLKNYLNRITKIVSNNSYNNLTPKSSFINQTYMIFYKKTHEEHKKINSSSFFREKESGNLKSINITWLLTNINNKSNVDDLINQYKNILKIYFQDKIKLSNSFKKCFMDESLRIRTRINNNKSKNFYTYCIPKNNDYIMKFENINFDLCDIIQLNLHNNNNKTDYIKVGGNNSNQDQLIPESTRSNIIVNYVINKISLNLRKYFDFYKNSLNNDVPTYIVFYKKTKNEHKKINFSSSIFSGSNYKFSESGFTKALRINNFNNIEELKQEFISNINNKIQNSFSVLTSTKCKKKNYRIRIDDNTYCINKSTDFIKKIEQKDFDIGDIIYFKDGKYYKVPFTNSVILLYNFEVEYNYNYLEYSQHGYDLKNNKIIKFLKTKYNMKKISNNNKITNENYIKFKKNNNNNIQQLELGRLNNRKKILFCRDLIKVTNNNNNQNIKLPKILSNLKIYQEIFIQLYEIYLLFPSKTNKLNTFNKFNYNQITSVFNKLLLENTSLLKNYYNDKKIITKIGYETYYSSENKLADIIFKIDTNKKIILIGDTHGSFHSFFRIFLRLLKSGLIDNNLKLINCKLIILGDILDRGKFCFEILLLFHILFSINNNTKELNVILIRGNHEDPNYYNLREFKKKKALNNEESFIDFLKYCPSAIILNHGFSKFWLCHGGFNFRIIKSKFVPIDYKTDDFSNNSDWEICKIRQPNPHILWNDFTSKDNTVKSRRLISKDPNNFSIVEIGLKDLDSFLSMNNIDFIIRGHSDNYCNHWLLIKDNNNKLSNHILPLTFKYSYDLIKNKEFNSIKYEDIELLNGDKIKKFNNSFCKIYSKNFKDNKSIDKITPYPVLTISTNSDSGRNLYHDSYAILDIPSSN